MLTAETAIRWVTGVKHAKCQADRSPLFSAKVSEWSYTSAPSTRLHGIIRNKFNSTHKMEEIAKICRKYFDPWDSFP